MKIRKHASGNEYIHAGNVWVRNFTKKNVAAVQLGHLFEPDDYGIVLKNEQLNSMKPRISDESIRFKNVVIVSDGYGFKDRHKLISKMPKDVCVIAVNKALNKWELLSSTTPPAERRTINAYVINNPYKSSLGYLPAKNSKYFPTCVASIRTSHEFVSKYVGDVYTYMPTFENTFGFDTPERYHIDDYRNPVCAAIGLAYQFGVEKLMLMCCDDSFEDQREDAVQLHNGLWTYKPLMRSHEIIDANLYWLTHQEENEVKVVDYSSGPEYVNAAYIESGEDAYSFFQNQVEGTPNE